MKRTKQYILAGTIIVLFFNAACDFIWNPFSDKEKKPNKFPDKTIYSTVLNFMFTEEDEFVLSDMTELYDITLDTSYIIQKLPSLSKEVLEHYIERNKESVKLTEISGTLINLNLIDHDDESEWNTYFPDAIGLLHLSRPGYNKEKDQAIVYLSDFYGPLTGAGTLLHLVKDEEWKVKQFIMVWIS